MKTFWRKCEHIFRYENFKYVFLSQVLGNLGLNVQLVAISWLAYTLSDSELILGFIVGMQFWPLLFFGLYAGHVTDKYSKYEFIKWMQIAQMFFPFIIFLAIFFGFMNLYLLFSAASFLGLVRMFDSPLRASILSYVVPKDDIKSAFSLSSSGSQIARVAGPALGGFILFYFPVYICFLFTAIGYLVVVILYRQMNTSVFYINHETKNHDGSFKDSIKYVYTHKAFRDISFIGLFLGIFYWSYPTYFPIVAKTIFSLGAKEFSWMVSAYALGAIVGGVHSTHNDDTSYSQLRKLSIIFGSISTVFIFIPYFYLMLLTIFISGYFVSKLNIITNTIVRTSAEDKYLGTAVSLWMVITVGTTGIGSLYYGFVAEYFGIYIAVAVPATLFLFYSIFILRKV